MRRRPAALALAVLAVVATACAVPTQSAPSTMAPSKVPFGLLNPHPPTTTTTTQPKPSSYVSVQVFFLNSTDALTPVQRFVGAPAQLNAVLGSLMAGPSSSDPQGISTAIPSNVRVLSVTTQAGIVTVNMNAAFGAITGNSIEEAVAQIVATISIDVGNDPGVLFEIDGERTSVPIANGSQSQLNAPVYLIDFL
ncbi:MAG: GerMN domain-containing protein [Acidimicrobiales bacterium]